MATAETIFDTALTRVRHGRFQRWLSLLAGLSSVLSGLEVTYEHYRGSYNRRVMYTPVILSAALLGAGVAGFLSRRAAKTLLPAVSALTLADSAIGFYFHVKGIQRKPGGWRIPVFNLTMGPPLFAPLLFGTSAYLGLIAYFLERGSGDSPPGAEIAGRIKQAVASASDGGFDWEKNLRAGRFQKHLAAVTVASAFFSGFEALYSHYKNNFQYKVQWTPVVLTPLLMAAGVATIKSPRAGRTVLPAVSLFAMIDGGVGFGYHVRGVMRRPGGLKRPVYNLIYGPPVFAPLLFASSGFLGLLASVLRRER
jgi:hypothetical protein